MNFWKNWAKEDLTFYSLSAIVFMVTIGLLLTSYANGFESLIDINISSSLSNVTATISSFSSHFINFDINAENYIVRQSYEAGQIHLAETGSIIFLTICAFTSVLYISAVTRVKKIIWFSLLMTPFIAWIYFLKIDLLGVFGYFNTTFLILTMSLYLSLIHI